MESINANELLKYRDFAIQLAKEAGAIIKTALDTRAGLVQVSAKKDNPSDLVTETDQAVEAFIKKRLSETYPDHGFIGEETAAEGTTIKLTDKPIWIVDPIDGTTNFVHGFPFVAVSIGLTINRRPVVGVVFNPLLNELYAAAKGTGSYLNGIPLGRNMAPLEDLSQCLVATEAGSDRTPAVLGPKIKLIQDLLRPVEEGGAGAHSVRATGSAALNMCCVAKSSVDVYWEVGCWEWDVTAAIVIVEEAGGLVLTGGTTPSMEPVDFFQRKFLAIRPGEEESQHKVANQMWSFIPAIDAPRPPIKKDD